VKVARVSAADLHQLSRLKKDSGDGGSALFLVASGFILAILFFMFSSKREDPK
jgi:hypothetical protein